SRRAVATLRMDTRHARTLTMALSRRLRFLQTDLEPIVRRDRGLDLAARLEVRFEELEGPGPGCRPELGVEDRPAGKVGEVLHGPIDPVPGDQQGIGLAGPGRSVAGLERGGL